MSKKDKLLEQLKSGKLTQSGGATINLTDSLNTNVTFSATSTPVGTFSNVQSILNAIQHSQYSANTAGANIASLSANIKNDIFGNNYFNNMETYGAGNSNTFLTSASLFNNDSNIGGLPLYIADQITAGMSSVPGVAGPAGPAGPKGDAGAAGAAGPVGPVGPAGPKGDAGAAGPVGPVGPAGAAGPVGPVGPAGPKGDAGDAGAAGPVGPAGPAGPKGDAGAAGPVGPAGPKGDAGAAGPVGPVGPAGPKGDAGAAGPVGPVGPAGAAGPKGDAGAAGPAGPKGDAGAAGVFDPTTLTGDMVIGAINNFYRGITGATGATGATGTSGGAMYGGSFNSSNFNQLNLDETGTLGSFNYPNRLLTLYDFIGDGAGNFNTTAQDLAAALNTLPLAQFKHLPSKNALALTSGGGKKQNRRRTSDKLVLKRK